MFAGGVRLAQGPVRIDGLKNVIVTRLESAVPGSEASLEHLDLVWFHDTNALGLRFDGLVLKDGKQRVIAASDKLEAALALDSLLLLHLSPAQITAEEFDIVLSVSPEGRYELGYDASGDPEAFDIAAVFKDLTGPEKLGRPISYTRAFDLKDGTISLSQVGSDLSWRAEVAHIGFSKRRDDIRAEIGLAVDSGGHWSYLSAEAVSKTGLKTAQLDVDIKDLVPSDIFPSVGMTRSLSALEANVNGTGHLSYSAAKGVEKASLNIKAGKGHYDFGSNRQPFDTIEARADYLPENREINFSTFRLRTHLLDTDLNGTVILVPDDQAKDRLYSIAFDFRGPRVSGHLAEDFSAQTLKDVHFVGAFIPEMRRLEITSGRGFLDKSPVRTKGVVYTDDSGRLGADLTAQVDGQFGKEQVFAFWPESLTTVLRADLIRRIEGGVYSNANFTLKAPPGTLRANGLKDEHLDLTFDYADMSLLVHDDLPKAQKVAGQGHLRGNSFDLSIKGGELGGLPVRDGMVSVESFDKADRGRTHIWLKSGGDVVRAVEIVDPLTGGQLSRQGLTRERLSGETDFRVDIGFVSFEHPLNYDVMDISFEADIRNAALKQAALGWDLTNGALKLKGDLREDRIEVRGPADIGPFRGEMGFRTGFVTPKSYIDFTGSFNARQFGGSPTRRVALNGALELANNIGTGTITSDIFNGRVDWSGSDARPNRVTLNGVTLSDGMKGQGLPIFARFKPEIPTEVYLMRAGDVWSGQLQAEGFTGELAYVEGRNPRLVYNALITPDRARLLGLGALPVFNRPRRLSVNIGLDAQSREALIRLDSINAVLGWSDDDTEGEPTRTLKARLTPHDLHLLGLPEDWFTPQSDLEVDALWEQDTRGIKGSVRLGATQKVAFDLPDMDTVVLTDKPKPWATIDADVEASFLKEIGYRAHLIDVRGRIKQKLSLYQTENTVEGALVTGEVSAAVLNLDASKAELRLAGTDWVKPLGEAAQLNVSFDEGGPEGGVNMPRIHAEGDRLSVEGRLALGADGDLEFADFSRIYFHNLADAALQVYQVGEPQTRLISVKGALLDMRPWKNKPTEKTTVSARAPAQPLTVPEPVTPAVQRPTRVIINLDQLRMAGDGAFRKVAFEGEWDGLNALRGEGKALSDNGNQISLSLRPDADLSRFTFVADDVGDMVYTATSDRRLRSGTLVMEGVYQNGQVDAVLKGEDIRVSQIPLLGQLLSLASLQGLSDTFTGEGIGFSDYEFPVRYRDNFLFIRDGWAKGEAIRINIRGGMDTKANTVDYNGTLIPAYGANAAFSRVPVVADVLTSNRGEGVLGIKYRLRGYADAPQAEIDPFSLVLPGFFRRLLDKDQPDLLPPIQKEK
ncbi:MAG: AsmA-like C-terminal region-containing protein [Asticcacaulis sp.]